MNGKRRRPFCQRAQVTNGGTSRRMQRVLTDFGADDAFAVAAKKVTEHYGVNVSAYRACEITYKHARRMEEQTPAPCRALPAKGAAMILAEADGCMVPTVKISDAPPGADRRKHRKLEWKELRLVAARDVAKVQTHYAATMNGVEAAGALWENVARAAGHALVTRVHGVGDGATWVASQCLRRLGPDVGYLLDLYHVCDYLAAVWPEQRECVQRYREHLKRGEVQAVLHALGERDEPSHLPDEQAPARVALRYLKNRPDQLDYPAALAAKLPIGSGLIESGNRHVLQRRLKQAGAWWLPENLNAMACLRTTRASGAFHAYWNQN